MRAEFVGIFACFAAPLELVEYERGMT